MLKKALSLIIAVCFLLAVSGPYPRAHADSVLGLPAPGNMVNLTPAYVPVIVKGLRVHPENPILFDFIVDTGNSGLSANDPQLKAESEKLIKYFLVSLTIPENDWWVNLSPYEKNRIIPDHLSQTTMGRDMLAEDYVLKQLTASMIYPEKNLGKEFWNRVYAKSQQLYGTSAVPVNTFNKVWIVADKAKVYVHANTAFVVASHLKVMLEDDYLALKKAKKGTVPISFGSAIIRNIILPELEKEVNTGKNFANLRQIFHSMILAAWYKKSLKEALLNQVYSNKAKINGVDLADKTMKEQIYKEYLKAYKKGVFNYIKEDIQNGQTVPRKYFSGGLSLKSVFNGEEVTTNRLALQSQEAQFVGNAAMVTFQTPATSQGFDAAMKTNDVRNAQRKLAGKKIEYASMGSPVNYSYADKKKIISSTFIIKRKIEPYTQVKLRIIELKPKRGLFFLEVLSKVDDANETIQEKIYLGSVQSKVGRILALTIKNFETMDKAYQPSMAGILQAIKDITTKDKNESRPIGIGPERIVPQVKAEPAPVRKVSGNIDPKEKNIIKAINNVLHNTSGELDIGKVRNAIESVSPGHLVTGHQISYNELKDVKPSYIFSYELGQELSSFSDIKLDVSRFLRFEVSRRVTDMRVYDLIVDAQNRHLLVKESNAAMLADLRTSYTSKENYYISEWNEKFGKRIQEYDNDKHLINKKMVLGPHAQDIVNESVAYFRSLAPNAPQRRWFYEWLQHHQSYLSANIIADIGLESYVPFMLDVLKEVALEGNPDGNPRAAARQIIEIAQEGTVGGYPVPRLRQRAQILLSHNQDKLEKLATYIPLPEFPFVAPGRKIGKLLLVRHAETWWNEPVYDPNDPLYNQWAGWYGGNPTPKGTEETLKRGEEMRSLSDAGAHFDYIVSSDLSRAKETMRLFLKGMGINAPFVISSSLREKHYGWMAGWRRSFVENTFGTTASHGEDLYNFWRRAPNGRAPGGENLNDVKERVGEYFIKEILPRLLRGENVMISAHGNSLRAIIIILEEHNRRHLLSREEVINLEVPQAQPIAVTFGDEWKANVYWSKFAKETKIGKEVGISGVMDALKDPAMKVTDVGGIDLNAQNVLDVGGQKINIPFDQAILAQFKRRDFSGVRPVIMSITPLKQALSIR